MASSTGIAGTNCIFKAAEGHICGDTKVYGTTRDTLRFCWAHYVLRCAECGVKQSLFECSAVLPTGTYCRVALCSADCLKAHQQKHHANWYPMQKKVPIHVVFADGSIHDHVVPDGSLTEEIVFEHPVTREHARCLKKPSAPGAAIVYAEMPRQQKLVQTPVEAPKPPFPRPPVPPFPRAQNALTGFSLHVSWLSAIIETRDERIVNALPVELVGRLEAILVETTVALLEVKPHSG